MLSGTLIPPHIFDHLNELLKRNFEPAVIAKVILVMCSNSRRITSSSKPKVTLSDKYNYPTTAKTKEEKSNDTRKTPITDNKATVRKDDIRRVAKIAHHKQAAKAESPVGLSLAFKMKQSMEEKKERQGQSIDFSGIRTNLPSFPGEDA